MQFILKETGLIQSATIILKGLTVIAGENDTGKTTMSKALFSAVTHHMLGHFPAMTTQLVLESDEPLSFPIFIDTPDFLSKFNYIKNTLVLVKQYNLNFSLPNYVGDLILRVSQPKKLTRKDKNFQQLKKIIAGEVYYDSQKDEVFYKKESIKKCFTMNQTANGIKMFGFLQILLLNQSIQKGTVLILDEPEVHLHPKWQLEYAQVIVKLVNAGVNVLINSHSPYLIEALELYSKKLRLYERHFYLAEKIESQKYSTVTEVTDNLERIYQKFAEPFQALEILENAE